MSFVKRYCHIYIYLLHILLSRPKRSLFFFYIIMIFAIGSCIESPTHLSSLQVHVGEVGSYVPAL